MEFGLFFLMQRDEAWSEQAVYDSALEQMLAAEPHGYASVWIAEHHFIMGYQQRIATLRSDSLGGGLPDSFNRSLVRLRPFREYLDDGLAMIGSPDEVRDRMQEYLDATGYRRVLLLMALPGLGTAEALRSMELFADEVRPAMRPVAQRA